MPKVQNLNSSPVRVYSVVDIQRGMEEPSDVRMPFNRSADVREGLKKIKVVEKIQGKLLGRFGALFPRPTENLLQVG